jgi:hypothetical protein
MSGRAEGGGPLRMLWLPFLIHGYDARLMNIADMFLMSRNGGKLKTDVAQGGAYY